MLGLFPSNFVEVLDDSFRPASRASSPMPERSPSQSPFNPQPSVKAKPKPSRKPFQSYSQPDTAAIKRAELQKKDTLSSSRAPSPNPMSVHDNIGSVPAPQIRGYGSRALFQLRQCISDTAREHHLLLHTGTMATDPKYRLQLHLSNTHIIRECRPQIHNSTSARLHHHPLPHIEPHTPRMAPAPSMHTTVVTAASEHPHLVLHHLGSQV